MANPFDHELDPGIVTRARRGDMKAHAVLFQAFAPAVHGAARRLVRSPEVADEVVQDTFVEVIHSIGGFRGEAPVGAWIRRIAVNKALMHLRSYWERNRDGLPTGEDGDAAELAAPAAPELHGRLDLEIALGLLPPPARTVAWLHDVEGYTHEEIGELLGQTPSYSKSQLARGYARLRELLHRDRDTVAGETERGEVSSWDTHRSKSC
jgi:RNA polymerase sigma-70 factor (ECF subfamily)